MDIDKSLIKIQKLITHIEDKDLAFELTGAVNDLLTSINKELSIIKKGLLK